MHCEKGEICCERANLAQCSKAAEEKSAGLLDWSLATALCCAHQRSAHKRPHSAGNTNQAALKTAHWTYLSKTRQSNTQKLYQKPKKSAELTFASAPSEIDQAYSRNENSVLSQKRGMTINKRMYSRLPAYLSNLPICTLDRCDQAPNRYTNNSQHKNEDAHANHRRAAGAPACTEQGCEKTKTTAKWESIANLDQIFTQLQGTGSLYLRNSLYLG